MPKEYLYTPFNDWDVVNVMKRILATDSGKHGGGYYTRWIPSTEFRWQSTELFPFAKQKADWKDIQPNDMLTICGHGDAVWSSYLKWKEVESRQVKKHLFTSETVQKKVTLGKTWFGVTDTFEHIQERIQPAYEANGHKSLYLTVVICACISGKGGLFGKSFSHKLAKKFSKATTKKIHGTVIGYPGIINPDVEHGTTVSGSGRFEALWRYGTGNELKGSEATHRLFFPIDIK